MRVLNVRVCSEQTNFICPQVEHMGPGYRWDDPDSVTRMVSRQRLATAPNLSAFHLDADTRPTDLISQSFSYAMGLLASDAMLETLREHTVQAHEVHQATVVYRGVTLPYAWVHMTESVAARVDYAASDFAVRADGTDVGVSPADADGLRGIARTLVDSASGELVARRIAFTPGTPPYDLFCLELTGLTFFVSDRLVATMTKRALNGFELAPTDIEVVFG